MSCAACSAIIDCSSTGGIISDTAPVDAFYATQDYTFVLDCPPGYICFPGYYPRVIIIPKDSIPAVTGGGCIVGCQGLICVGPSGNPRQDAQAAQAQWARQEANCINQTTGPGPGVPPPVFVGGSNKRVDVGNTEQCYTAHCTPDSAGPPATVCTPARTYEVTLFNPTPAEVQAAQQQFNQNAMADAVAKANAALTCGICNVAQTGSMFCPGNPGLNSNLTIPAGTYCQVGGDVDVQNSKAQADLINGLATLQSGLGCTCLVNGVNASTKKFSTNCPQTYQVTRGGQLLTPFHLVTVNSLNFDFDAFYYSLEGFHLSGNVCFLPLTYTGPTFCFKYS